VSAAFYLNGSRRERRRRNLQVSRQVGCSQTRRAGRRCLNAGFPTTRNPTGNDLASLARGSLAGHGTTVNTNWRIPLARAMSEERQRTDPRCDNLPASAADAETLKQVNESITPR